MRLEDEIKTKGFRNELHKLNINLVFTYNWLVDKIQEKFQPYGITMQQFNLLRILRGQYPNPSTVQLLKARMLDRQSDASRLVDRLTAKGLVDRKICSKDRRKMDILISPAGLELLERMESDVEALDGLFAGISEAEAKSMNALLDRIRENE